MRYPEWIKLKAEHIGWWMGVADAEFVLNFRKGLKLQNIHRLDVRVTLPGHRIFYVTILEMIWLGSILKYYFKIFRVIYMRRDILDEALASETGLQA